MASDYCNDDHFVDKSIQYFYYCNVDDAVSILKDYIELVRISLMRCQNKEDNMPLYYLDKVINLLSQPLAEIGSVQSVPTAWDSEAWLKEFLSIWNRRIHWEHHMFRAKYYKHHTALVEAGCYISQSGKEIHIPWDAYAMMAYTSEFTVQPLTDVFNTKVEIWQMDCLDAAKKIQLETEGITAVLNLANRQNPGGGVYTGSGAQEESCFLRSNYFTALYPFAEYANQYDLPKSKEQYPLDRNFGGVWSKGITVFRGLDEN